MCQYHSVCNVSITAFNESPSGRVWSGEVDNSFMCQAFAELLGHVSYHCVFIARGSQCRTL